MANKKTNTLDLALENIKKQFGNGAINRLDGDIQRIPAIPTGILQLDVALGIGGLPRGRVIEIFGPESSGKTTVALQVAGMAHTAGEEVAFVDAEHALDPSWARKNGVNVEQLLVSQPDNGEEALQIVEMLVRSGGVSLVIVDSVAALTPRAEIEGEMGDSHVGLQARLMSQALRKISGAVKDTNTTVAFINQLREKIGVSFGSPETTPGGRALKFYSSVRLDVRRIETLKGKDGNNQQVAIGNRIRVKVVKNKVAPPFRQAEFRLIYNDGLCPAASALDLGLAEGLVRKSGAWYSYNDEQIGQGEENSRQFLLANPDVLDELTQTLRARFELDGPVDNPTVEDVPADEDTVPVS